MSCLSEYNSLTDIISVPSLYKTIFFQYSSLYWTQLTEPKTVRKLVSSHGGRVGLAIMRVAVSASARRREIKGETRPSPPPGCRCAGQLLRPTRSVLVWLPTHLRRRGHLVLRVGERGAYPPGQLTPSIDSDCPMQFDASQDIMRGVANSQRYSRRALRVATKGVFSDFSW